MHSALHIDELLHAIFENLEDDRHSLSKLAQCCIAWRDPALDHLWFRLHSLAPLLKLIAAPVIDCGGVLFPSQTVSEAERSRFCSYARRIRRVEHRRELFVHANLERFLRSAQNTFPCPLLPNLKSVHISASASNGFCSMVTAPAALKELTLDFGFKNSKPQAIHDDIQRFMQQAVDVSHGLVQLCIRGSAPPQIASLAVKVQNIQVLSLQMGSSLPAQVLYDALHLPNLRELDVQAAHLEAGDIASLSDDRSDASVASLHKLRLRGHVPLIQHFLRLLPTSTLRSLDLEIEDDDNGNTPWSPIFSIIRQKAEHTLHHLKLEHHCELETSDDNSSAVPTNQSATTDANADTNPDNNMYHARTPFSSLEPLRFLRKLRSLEFDMTFPPRVSDTEFTILCNSWPAMEHLDLGSLADPRMAPQQPSQRLTLTSLTTVAEKLPNLHTLILPLDISAAPTKMITAEVSPSKLARLHISYPMALNEPFTTSTMSYLQQLFPSLETLEGFVGFGTPEGADQATRAEASLNNDISTPSPLMI